MGNGSKSRRVARWGGARISRRLLRSVPFFGAGVALFYLGSSMRRKGVVGGALDSGLNAIPFVGAAKTVAEMMRGEDFIRDLPPARRGRASPD
jgi:hypothetical protein